MRIWTFIVISFMLQTLSSQSRPDGFWDNIRYGGGLGLGFGSNSFNIAVSPSAIYDTGTGVALGTGLSFNYAKLGDTKLTAYGGRLLSYYNTVDFIQLSAEFEQLRIDRKFDLADQRITEQYWLPALFLGVGYGNRNFVVGVRYDVLYDEGRSLYADPWLPFVRVFF